MERAIGASGKLSGRLIKAPKAPLSWRLRNTLRFWFIWGWIVECLARGFSALFGIPTITSRLEARLIRADGSVINFGIISRRVVTQNGVGFIIDDWDNSTTDITTLNFHACGTGTNAENQTDTALQTEATAITDRQSSTKTQPAYNQLQMVATQAFTNTGAITEHGILSVVTEGSGVLWDRSQFTAINVGNGDSIQWTYTLTINPNG